MVACPVAAIVQNFAELLGEGQETGAGVVLLGTTLSALTIPLIVLLFPYL
jgi:predicted permease